MSQTTPRICVVGSTNIDLTFRTSRLPRPGETLAGKVFHLGFGGKGANQAIMAARLGARVAMIGRVGRDPFGDLLVANYRSHGVDTTHVLVDAERASGVASITVDDEARNCILVVPGANLDLSPIDVRSAASAIEGSAILICQLEVPIKTVREAMRLARAAGVRTILNPAPAAPLDDELLALADLCVPNETEIQALTGLPAGTRSQAEEAARALALRGPRTVIVTLGDRGALVLENGEITELPVLPVEAIDPTGAGDAFIGSLAVYLAEGTSTLVAAQRANAAAALSVTRIGAQSALPTREEVEAFLTRN